MIPEELIWQVLVHLPTKSLMRFKCVSKLWYSIIRSRKFANAHRGVGGGCFRGLLIRDIYLHPENLSDSQLLFYLSIDGGPKLMQHQLTIDELTEHCKSTQVVKGLIGLYNNLFGNFTLCNIATHEMLKLPPSPSLSKDFDFEFTYYLGFDVVEEVFKVLSICHLLDEEEEIIDRIVHVFTFGVNNTDMNWRNIATPLDFYNEESQRLYINGVLYWLPYEYKNPSTLTAFHLNSETFESIDISEVMLQRGYPTLVEICGRPDLYVINLSDEGVAMLDVWTMNNYSKGGELAQWTRKRVVLPTSLCYEDSLNFDANMLPTGEMILAYRESDSLPLRIYIYDPLKNELDSIIVEEEYGCQRSDIYSQESDMEFDRMRMCYFEENLISLDSLMEDHTINTFSVILKNYPNLFRSVSMYKESQKDLIMQGICLADSEKVRELEDCWKELCVKESETEFHCRKMELLAAQSKLARDALKQKWQDMFSNFDVDGL